MLTPELFSLPRVQFTRWGGSAHDDTSAAGLVRRPTRLKRAALLGRSKLDTAPSAKADFPVDASATAAAAAPAAAAASAEPAASA